MASQTAGGTQQKRNEGIASYIGISAPETPRYLLTNNFLADYFEPSKEEDVYDFDTFTQRGTLYTEDEANQEPLKASFDLFLKRYLGEEAIREEKKQADVDKMLDEIILHVKGNDVSGIKNDFAAMEEELRECRYDRRSAGVILQRVVDMLDELCKLSEMENGQREASKEEILESVLKAEGLREAVDILSSYCREVGGWLDSQRNVGGKKYAVLAMDYIEKNELGLISRIIYDIHAMEDLDEMNNFLDRYQIPKLNQDQTNHVSSPITPKELEADLQCKPSRGSQGPQRTLHTAGTLAHPGS